MSPDSKAKKRSSSYAEQFLAILQEDLHVSNDGIFERTTRINWLEP